jgi:hypothetical protein
MRKAIAVLVAVAAMALGTGTALAAEKHPPKFGPHDTNCTAGPNQPHCPGSH